MKKRLYIVWIIRSNPIIDNEQTVEGERMKKMVSVLLAASLTMAALAGCGSSSAEQGDSAGSSGNEPVQESEAEAAEEGEAPEETTTAGTEKGGDLNGDGKIVVGYISKNITDVFQATLNMTAQERLDQLVADGVIDEWTGILDGNTDPSKQRDVAEDCINYPCDYVILVPAESLASDPALVAMVDAGISVVVANASTESTQELALTYCGSDDVYAGELLGNYVMEQVPEGGVYIHCQGVIGNSAQIQRGEGIEKTIGASGEWTNGADIPCDWDGGKAVNAVNDYLAKYGVDLKAVICDNDDMSSAAQAECNAKGREDIVCIGVDGNQGPLKMVKEGTLGATVLQDGVGQIGAAVDAIVASINGETVEKNYTIPFITVTAENVDEYLQ